MPTAPQPYDEMLEHEGDPRAHCSQYYVGCASSRPSTSPEARRSGRPVPPRRHHLRRLRRDRGHRAADPLRYRAAHPPRRRVDTARAGPEAARAGAQCLPRRYLPRAAHPAGRPHTPRADPVQPAVPPGDAGSRLPGGIHAHISGVDIVRDTMAPSASSRTICACPSGVSYMLENRKMMMRSVPELFARAAIEPVEHYPDVLHGKPQKRGAPGGVADPTVVLLTPGGLQQRLLRACLSRPADGHRTGGGSGPVRARCGAVHAHHAGTRSAWTCLPAGR